jgi:hypothetical protein
VSVCRTPLDGTFAGNVPGESGGGESSDFSHVRTERVPGVEALKRCEVFTPLERWGYERLNP